MIGIGLAAVFFYSLVNSHYLGLVISRTLGPYSDSLAAHGFAGSDPEIWQRMAERHGVSILFEPVDGEPLAYDAVGRPIAAASFGAEQITAVRTAADGRRVTLHWSLLSFRYSHLPLMAGLLLMVAAVVGSAFWFLQRQLGPLAGLRRGVDALAAGSFEACVPVVRDDEIGQVTKAFNQMAARIGEMIDDRERLLADVSHELRSPVTRMKVALELLPAGDKRGALDRDLREMENLISVLLERERLRGRQRIEGEAVDLKALVAEVVRDVEPHGPGVELVSNGPVRLDADPVLLKVLIRNLLDNAVKFSRPDSRPIELRVDAEGDEVALRVIDDGVGIPPGGEEKLLEPFVKLDPARGHRVGYGLGLSLCQRIVELHGGTIGLRSRDEGGTEVIITLKG